MRAFNTANIPLNLKVPDSKKVKDWYIDYMEYSVPYKDAYIEDYNRLHKNYQIYNGDLSSIKEETKKVCNPLGVYSDFNIEEELVSYPKLHNLVNILKGEKLKRVEDFKVMILSAKAIKDKNEQLLAAISASVEERVQIKIQEMQARMEGMPPTEIEKMIQELRTQEEPADIRLKNFTSEWEIFYSHALKFCKTTQETKAKELDTIADLIINDRFFVHSGWKHGVPVVEVWNPLSTKFHKSPNEPKIHKGDWIAHIDTLSPAQVIEEYIDDLSDKEIEEYSFISSSIRDKRNSLGVGSRSIQGYEKDYDYLEELYDENIANQKRSDGLYQSQNLRENQLVTRTRFEFKAFKPVYFMSYINELGEKLTLLVRNDFEIPKTAEKVKFTNKFGHKTSKYVWMDDDSEYTAEEIWIPRKYEITRLDSDKYLRYREVPYQTTNLENPYANFSLSTKGIVLTARNADSVSLFERALPLYMQYLFVKNIQNRELAKYEGYVQNIDIDQIPESLGKDVDGEIINDPLKVALVYQRYLGKNFYSGSQVGVSGLPNPQRTPGGHGMMLSTANEIYLLQQLLELLEREMSMSMGISPQRQAAFSSNSNVSDNQQAIAQSHHITEPLFFAHSQVWADVFNDYLGNFRTYAERVLLEDKEEHSLEYLLEDGTRELFKITNKSVEMLNTMVFCTNTGNNIEYQNYMKQNSQAFSQNPDGMESVSMLLKSITSGQSAEETHKLIQLEIKKQQDRMQANQEASIQSQEKMAQMQKEQVEDAQAHEIQLMGMRNASSEKIAAMNNTARSEDKDADNDGVPDYMEVLKLGQDAEIKSRELDIKDRDMDIKESKLRSEKEIKEKDIASKEKIAASKSTQNSN